jgi:4a-hydroxytetrahydrobiopterin dehydratase
MVQALAERELIPPRKKGVAPLQGSKLDTLMELLGNQWQILERKRLEKLYEFEDFQTALDFTNQVGTLAEAVDHHPEIYLTWGKVRITIWTHSIGGLSEADFVFAAKADQLAYSPDPTGN